MFKEIQLFLHAIQFYTRLPVTRWVRFSEDSLNRSLRYFPLVGWLIGLLALGIFSGFHLFLSPALALFLSIAGTVFATGAFHEDGFADSCDAFGGGYTPERILTIMKDSRIGTYGTVGLIFILGLKLFALIDLSAIGTPLLLTGYFNGHILSRWNALHITQWQKYVRDIDQSKAKPIAKQKLSKGGLFFATLFSFLPLALLYPLSPLYLVAAPLAILGGIFLSLYYQKKIGGYTGDCLGAVQQITELIFLLSLLALSVFCK